METIETLIQQIEQIKISLYNKINELPQNEQLQIISEKPKCYIINFSNIVGNPFNVEYYDFKKQYEVIITYLQDCPIENFGKNLNKIIMDRFVICDQQRYNLNPKVITYLESITL